MKQFVDGMMGVEGADNNSQVFEEVLNDLKFNVDDGFEAPWPRL